MVKPDFFVDENLLPQKSHTVKADYFFPLFFDALSGLFTISKHS